MNEKLLAFSLLGNLLAVVVILFMISAFWTLLWLQRGINERLKEAERKLLRLELEADENG